MQMSDFKAKMHHEDAGRTTSMTGPVTECVRTAQDRTAWRANMALALAFDLQQ